MTHPPRSLLIVIDAQKAFADPNGSLARAYGYDEIRPGVDALGELHRFLSDCPPSLEVVFVRSEYNPAQFTDGDLDHPLANVCVPTFNVDCEWAEALDVRRASCVITKRQADAMDSADYRDLLDRFVALGGGTLYFAGFQLTTCVKATAISTATRYRSQGVRVAVLKWLTGARVSSYQGGDESQSRVEQACSELKAFGVDVFGRRDDFAASAV